MKKIVALMLVLCAVFLSSCGADDKETVPDATDTAETTVLDEITSVPDDTTATTADTESVISEVTVEPYYLTDFSERYIVSIKTSAVKTSNIADVTNAINNYIKSFTFKLNDNGIFIILPYQRSLWIFYKIPIRRQFINKTLFHKPLLLSKSIKN